ncbi:MAG: 6-carboxytetrahydropterin synthase [Chloroflexi bacterium]|nr:6-carboxytetrahydropterin synthase [Chloroflexota bacterium]
MPYKVTVERNTLRFAAAHFATFEDSCEPLHGHNYDVRVEVEGELTEVGWLVDFALMKSMTRALCQELDHKFILQRDSKVLKIDEGMSNWKIRYQERGYVFPKADVVALPISNSTAEQLARWFGTTARAARGARRDERHVARRRRRGDAGPGRLVAGGIRRYLTDPSPLWYG